MTASGVLDWEPGIRARGSKTDVSGLSGLAMGVVGMFKEPFGLGTVILKGVNHRFRPIGP